jgi:hypothetical protein
MTELRHCGGIFHEKMDWFAFLLDVAHGRSSHGLRPDLDIEAGLGELYEALQGTPMQSAMASAALRLFETGTHQERDMMRAIPFEEAPGAKERLLRLLEQDHDRLTTRDVTSVLYDLLEKNPGDPEVKAMLQRELERPDSKLTDFGLAARHLPDWFLRNFLSLRVPPDIDGMELFAWLARVPESQQPALLERIAALGRRYVDAMVAKLLDPWWPADTRKRLETLLEAQPVFRQALAEASKKPAT